MAEFPHGAIAEHAFVAHEHRELARGINHLSDVARLVHEIAAPDLSREVAAVVQWVDEVLEPHTAWEELFLYPELDERAHTTWATRLMRFEHGQIRALVDRVRADLFRLHHEPSREEAQQLRADLLGLDALLRAHVEREEACLFPLLDLDLRSGIS
jgi:hemerythrin-like domain-containing protein